MASIKNPSAIFLLTLVVWTAHPGQAGAARCGDDVEGVRVACACGDVLVSDARLLPTDPIAKERCQDDGLLVRAGRGVESLTFDLGGQSLTGQGFGSGIRIMDGGSDGAILIGGPDGRPGQIAGFRVGISAQGTRDLRAAVNLLVLGNETDGVRVSGRGSQLQGVVSDENGGSGFRARGRDHALDGVSANGNGRVGVRMSGNGHYLGTDARTREGDGTHVTGSGNVIESEEAR
jgi:hypothetical protein